MLGAFQAVILRHGIESGGMLKHEVIDYLDISAADLMLHDISEELHELEPGPPRWIGPHLVCEKRVEDVKAVQREVHALRASHANCTAGRGPSTGDTLGEI